MFTFGTRAARHAPHTLAIEVTNDDSPTRLTPWHGVFVFCVNNNAMRVPKLTGFQVYIFSYMECLGLKARQQYTGLEIDSCSGTPGSGEQHAMRNHYAEGSSTQQNHTAPSTSR